MNFYNGLTSNGVFFFWIVVFLVILILVLLIVLLNKNKKLKDLTFEKEDKNILPIKSDTDKKNDFFNIKLEDSPSVEEIEKEEDKKEEIVFEEEPKIIPEEGKKEISKIELEEIKEEKPKIDKKEEKTAIEVSTPVAYQRNVLREMSRRMPISPIHIERSEYGDDATVYTAYSKLDNEIDNVNLREDNFSPLENMKDSYEMNDSMKFASEIISKMEEEMKPSNIELTDYEKKQEEEAIISYDELQKVKDKIYNLTEEEETDDFIDELKNFRLDLR